MAALSANRSTTRDNGPIFRASYPIADNVHIYQGALVQLLTTGYVTPAGTATQSDSHTFLTVGRAIREYDNTVSGHSLGALIVEVEYGIMEWDILGTDTIAQSAVGTLVYAEDDHTVRATSNSTTRAAAGRCVGLITLPGFASQQAKVFTIPGTP